MKEKYLKPEIIEEKVEIEDVIAASFGTSLPGDNDGEMPWFLNIFSK